MGGLIILIFEYFGVSLKLSEYLKISNQDGWTVYFDI